MLRGLTTVVYPTPDLAAAKSWYTQLLGIEPYFDRTAYVEFRTGDYAHELGLLDTTFAGELTTGDAPNGPVAPVAATAAPGVIVYWHVDDVQATLDRMTALGATLHHPPRDFGEGFVGAAVLDPFGNVVGIMHNPHYLDVLATSGRPPAGSADR